MSQLAAPVAPAVQTDDAPVNQSVPTRIDIERIAYLVYQMLLQDLTIERERGGLATWHLKK